MANSSPAKVRANQANSRKSTGPRDTTRTCKNATKHGLRGRGEPLLPEDRALLEHRITCWAEETGATGDLEHAIIGRAAEASVRLYRAEATESDNARARMTKAHVHRVGHAKGRLAAAERALAAWDLALSSHGFPHAVRVALGAIVREDPETPGPVLAHLIALRDREQLGYTAEDMAAARHAFREVLLGHRAEAVATIEARYVALVEAEMTPPSDGWLDGSARGDLLRRYIVASERSFYRALAELGRTRKLPDSPVLEETPNEAKTDDFEGSYGDSESDAGERVGGLVLDPPPHLGPPRRWGRVDEREAGLLTPSPPVGEDRGEGDDTPEAVAEVPAPNEAKTPGNSEGYGESESDVAGAVGRLVLGRPPRLGPPPQGGRVNDGAVATAGPAPAPLLPSSPAPLLSPSSLAGEGWGGEDDGPATEAEPPGLPADTPAPNEAETDEGGGICADPEFVEVFGDLSGLTLIERRRRMVETLRTFADGLGGVLGRGEGAGP